MNQKSNWISFIALFVLVVALPVYALREPTRLRRVQAEQRYLAVEDGAVVYIRYCAVCHGQDGAGVGVMPPLNHPALAEADADMLHKTIARAAHGTTMAAWHIQEGGALTDYQISELVTLIQMSGWDYVGKMAVVMNFEMPAPPEAEMGEAFLQGEVAEDPHRCAACHEDPVVHKDRFGLNCARCHSSMTWKPAYLTRHVFYLDHGGAGLVACATCHVENYYTHTCYECHDHTPEQMQQVHIAENIPDYEACMDCHPTGQPDEARQIMQAGGYRFAVSSFDLAEPLPLLSPDD